MNVERYKQSEARAWGALGLTPRELEVPLRSTGTSLRVQEVGEGDPAIFIHGGPGAGAAWGPLVQHLPGVRALLVDRPGSGLSAPFPLTAENYGEFAAAFVGDIVDALELGRADVVASSFGSNIALRSAAGRPERVRRMVHVGAPAAVPGQQVPAFMARMKSGILRKIVGWLPPNANVNLDILRQLGHGATIDAGKMPQVFLDWHLDLARHTDTMRRELDLVGRHYLPKYEAFALDNDLLARVEAPCLLLWGEADAFGGAEDARSTAKLLPNSELVLLPDAGHQPWLDFPQDVAQRIAAFLSTAS